MAFVDSYSFSHRFSDKESEAGYAGYQEVTHQCQDVDALALTRQFFHFAIACGYIPSSILEAFEGLTSEYAKPYGYHNKKSAL